MADSLQLDTATIVAIWCESILYGVFLVLFGMCVYVLGPMSVRSEGRRINKTFLYTSLVLFLLISTHMAVNLFRVLDAFVTHVADPPLAYLNDLAQWPYGIREELYITLTVLGDSILIYRCWEVYGRRWIVIVVPIILCTATAVAGYGAATTCFLLIDGSNIFTTQVKGWITSFCTMSLVSNSLTTGLIVLRIWRGNSDVVKFGHSSLWPVIAIVLESGAMYSTSLFILLMVYVANSNSQYILLDVMNPIIGIVFSLIIVRVGLNRVNDRSSLGLQSIPRSTHAGARTTVHYPMNRVNVSVSRSVQIDESGGEDETVDLASVTGSKDFKASQDLTIGEGV